VWARYIAEQIGLIAGFRGERNERESPQSAGSGEHGPLTEKEVL